MAGESADSQLALMRNNGHDTAVATGWKSEQQWYAYMKHFEVRALRVQFDPSTLRQKEAAVFGDAASRECPHTTLQRMCGIKDAAIGQRHEQQRVQYSWLGQRV